jgi:NADH dehydrogenase
LGVEILNGVTVTNVKSGSVCLKSSSGETTLAAHTVLWAAGTKGSVLGLRMGERAGTDLDRAGRVIVNPDLSVPGYPNVYVIGDLAVFKHDPATRGMPLPGVCQVAMQQGKFVADRLRLKGGARPMAVFKYHDRGSMAVIGRNAAVALIGKMKFSGFIAWVLWMFIHIMFLIEFDNKVKVFVEWAWSYVTWNRGSRLITNDEKAPVPIG